MDVQLKDHLELMRDRANTFPDMGDISAIRTARIWHCSYRSLMPISGMINVEELVIGIWPDPSLEVLSRMSRLRYLRIVHMPKVIDLASLEHLQNLEVLSLGTLPSWDAARKCTIVDSLAPICKLSKLKQLELFGICSADKSLRDLLHCPQLQSARFSHYPNDEVENFFRATGLAEAFAVEPSFR
jgi:hypothetical protein